nr:MAG TPA: hypothetical protein [Caudoviricetes sp.]
MSFRTLVCYHNVNAMSILFSTLGHFFSVLILYVA